MARTAALLVNPRAGRGLALRAAAETERLLTSRGTAVRRLISRDADEAADLAAAAVSDGVDVLVAVGGDGSVAVALQAVAATDTALGIVPTGTGNDIARALDLPWRDPSAAALVVADGEVRRVDLGRCTTGARTRFFAGVLATGFDSLVNERANAMSRRWGRHRYHTAMIMEIVRLGAIPYEIGIDGQTERRPATLVAVGNAASYGGGMRITPTADLTDGLLDVTVIGPIGRARLLRIFPEVYPGTFVRWTSLVEQHRGRVVEIHAAGGVAYADGERVGPLPVRIEAVPGALRVLVPSRPS